jgi:ribosome biogenesis GTPase
MRARVIEVHRTNCRVSYAGEERLAVVRGSFHVEGNFPVVGDYVEVSTADDSTLVIESIEERQSVIKRKSADDESEQVLVANIDLMMIVMGLDNDFNESRLERYLLLAEQSEVRSLIVLNKMDTVSGLDNKLAKVRKIAGEVPVVTISALTGEGINALKEYLPDSTTAVLLGSSGAGKSTITNQLLPSAQQSVQATREDDNRGRHTTTSRQLFRLPSGAYLIDTPGMRELGMVESHQVDTDSVFELIEEYAANCQFRNCDHEHSQGCAVLEAVAQGELSERAVNNYHKLKQEMIYNQRKESGNKERYQEQIMKRQRQYLEAKRRKRLNH